ncbi:carbohydrate kinase family protein [Roseivirga pacifica]|uniref:carbohydrate kinase family protein n=1 Tax=Roseivirga pacifica TaxID=1267423 RepID=UPI003BA986EC
MKYEVAVIADLCMDLLVAGDVKPIYGQVEQYVNDYQTDIGGSGSIFAAQYNKLGGNAAMFGIVGEDDFGSMLTQKIEEIGMSTDFLFTSENVKTALGLNLAYEDDRAMLTYKGTLGEVSEKQIKACGIFDKTDHVHISSYFLLDQLHSMWVPLLSELELKGVSVSLDTNWAPEGNWSAVHPLLPYIDVFIPNEEEALQISGMSSCDEAGRWLSSRCGMVVMKRGANGARVFKGETVRDFSVPEALAKGLKIADTTGAGDNFGAGFVWSWLRNKPLEEAIKMAITCGTSSLRKLGGIEGQYVPHAVEA